MGTTIKTLDKLELRKGNSGLTETFNSFRDQEARNGLNAVQTSLEAIQRDLDPLLAALGSGALIGQRGVGIKSVEVETGEGVSNPKLVITYDDAQVGPTEIPLVYIQDIQVDGENLKIILTNNTEYIIENVRGPRGEPGRTGPRGPRGPMICKANVSADGNLMLMAEDGTAFYVGNIRGPQGEPGPRGGSVRIKGSYNSYKELLEEHPVGVEDEAYLVNSELYVWDGTKWINVGSIKGDQGPQGPVGPQGLSIARVELTPDYKLAIYFTNDENSPAATLGPIRGPEGAAGRGIEGLSVDNLGRLLVDYTDGSKNVPVGYVKGDAGHSPVLTIQNGKWYIDGSSTEVFVHTIQDASIEDNNLVFDVEDMPNYPHGKLTVGRVVGKSAYEIAKDLNKVPSSITTEEEWVDSLKGTSINILGSYTSEGTLRAEHQSGNPGDAYLVNGDLYVWTGSLWDDVGNIQGPTGPQGPQGLSAYEIAVNTKSTTETTAAAWVASLKGEKGDRGDAGDKGDKGDTGDRGDKGDKGDTGAQGTGIESLRVGGGTLYYTLNDGTSEKSAGEITAGQVVVNINTDDNTANFNSSDIFDKIESGKIVVARLAQEKESKYAQLMSATADCAVFWAYVASEAGVPNIALYLINSSGQVTVKNGELDLFNNG